MILSRRTAFGGLAAAPVLLTLAGRGLAAAPGYPFSLGVASGDPWPGSVMLWTRLAPQPLLADGGMPARAVPVRWELAEDQGFAKVVRHGTTQAESSWGHAVHVEATGLRPGRDYWYRFIAGGEASPVGRTRTAPAHGSTVERARFCFASCQKYEAGYYTAYRVMVEDAPDLVLFLGDYIYEGAPGTKASDTVRRHLNPEPIDLAGYRVRYATYKLDPLLQAAHQVAPWAATWDDHEVANDYAGAADQYDGDATAFLSRRAAAYHAYYEHMPLRAFSRPRGAALRLYRSLSWGDLARIQIVDDRQYRSPRACQPPHDPALHARYRSMIPPCPELGEPGRSLLGMAQERWLMNGLARKEARWNLLAQQTLMTSLLRVDPDDGAKPPHLYSADTWSGYPAARDRIVRRWAEAGTPNPIALGGDIHAFAAADLRHPDRRDGPPVASEFVGGSISSTFNDPFVKAEARESGIAFVENMVRGYGRADLTRAHCTVTFRAVADATKPISTVSDLARWVVEAGRAGLQRA